MRSVCWQPRAQFGGDGTRVYLLGLDRRTIDVFHVDGGSKLRTIAFDLPLEDQIAGFSVSPDGTRVLLTTGGDRNDLWKVEGFAHPTASMWSLVPTLGIAGAARRALTRMLW